MLQSFGSTLLSLSCRSHECKNVPSRTLSSLFSLSALPHTRARARYQRSSTAKARQPPLNLSVCVFSEKRYTAKHRPSFFVCGVRAALRESARHGTHLGCQAARARSAARTLNVSMLCRRFGVERVSEKLRRQSLFRHLPPSVECASKKQKKQQGTKSWLG